MTLSMRARFLPSAAVGILTNSQILIVGAMVVGPEYGAILSLAFGVTRRDPARVRESAAALAVGFTLAVVGALLLALIIRGGTRAQSLPWESTQSPNLIDTPTGSPSSSPCWPGWSAWSRSPRPGSAP